MRWSIYALSDPRTNEVRYIGRTVNVPNRIKEHISASNARKSHKNNWIQQLATEGLRPLAEVLESGSNSEYAEAEIRWIATYRNAGASLLNMTDGGDGVRGLEASPETRQKLRAARQKRGPTSEETRAKMRASQQRRPPASPQTREKMRAAALQQAPFTADRRERVRIAASNPSAETRAKMSDSGRKRQPPSAETRAKLALAVKNASPAVKARRTTAPKTFTPEGRARISAAHQGRKRSAETRAKQSVARKLYWERKKKGAN